jgi:hypothetical protein
MIRGMEKANFSPVGGENWLVLLILAIVIHHLHHLWYNYPKT